MKYQPTGGQDPDTKLLSELHDPAIIAARSKRVASLAQALAISINEDKVDISETVQLVRQLRENMYELQTEITDF